MFMLDFNTQLALPTQKQTNKIQLKFELSYWSDVPYSPELFEDVLGEISKNYSATKALSELMQKPFEWYIEDLTGRQVFMVPKFPDFSMFLSA